MRDYQALLNQAIALVQAERGFIVLYETVSGNPIEFVARHNFDSIVPPRVYSPAARMDRSLLNALPRVAKAGQSLLTYSYDSTYFDLPPHETIVPTPPPLSIIVVPLSETSLLWCDVLFKTRVFKPDQLQQLIELVQQDRTP